MKKALLLKPDIQQNQKFNGSKETSLKILSMNQSDLIRCFCEESISDHAYDGLGCTSFLQPGAFFVGCHLFTAYVCRKKNR